MFDNFSIDINHLRLMSICTATGLTAQTSASPLHLIEALPIGVDAER